ncbi:FAD-dependent monooxygenase [Sphaerisporangium siamense]|uniref:2-polyprenyl-6-methoxyphenol hydroxylase-like FAD-dependent oxidoreductase n=1 Tax=Sphaerisporangium siamense TaxID=795645 RepID=A0A7W7G6K4_9ACTN|nr:FAD-dependent monooxygenase [Sphaerisporangium siamense]MBB4699638.1 2-polyprenyl-6-methoxyphenol hydroxylase-like FAD-dependent oxidoreductase [Sphaerisporangium siamense]
MTSVLISGASVAGPALAYLLRRHGFAVTVVERAPAARAGGQAIDVRGAALTVADRIGILADVRRHRTHMKGMSMLDGDGNELWRSTEMALSSGRLGGDDVELLREDLSRLIHDRTRDDVEYVFGDSIATLDQDGHGVRVTFERSAPRAFDLVVGADGLHSAVRRLAFGPEREFVHHLGMYVSIFSTDNYLGLEDWQTWFNDGSVGGAVYPVRGNTELRVNLGFESPDPIAYDHRDVEAQKRLVADRCARARWEVPRLLKAMWDAPDFYFDSMAQVRMDRWSSGRVTLLGDAGYCASPLSGQGTSLALIGAYVLAAELARSDHETAFAAYESRMRPFVTLNQSLVEENRKHMEEDPDGESPVDRVKNAIELP